MFSTFRGRLLFWFFVFISFNLIIVVLTVVYLQQRESIATTTSLIEVANEALLKKVIAQQNFLSYDTKNPDFFEEGKSSYLDKSNALSDSTLQLISKVENSTGNISTSIIDQLQYLKIQVQSIDFQLNVMVQKIKLRGYKNLMREGKMREDVHWLENAPENALNAALEFEKALIPFNKEQEQIGNPPVKIGTGIHTGQMILGTIGNQERLETTVISDAVNIASRVEGLTKFYKAPTIITEEVILNLPEYHPFQYRFLDFVKVKGKSKTQSIFELISPDDFIKLSYQTNYNQAVILMREKQIQKAAQIFNSLYQVNPNDETIKV